MTEPLVFTPKSAGTLRKKQWLCLGMDLIIAVLGITSLYIKFSLDGVIAFRAFTVDGNLFTTLVSVASLILGIRGLIRHRETPETLYMLELCAAVTEAVIFIIVMLGYLPFVPDVPQITPYHMFCLHVAIPLMTIARFILFERPIGILKPTRLLAGAIPIGCYGIFVVIAIKTGVLPTAFIPYSFLDFENNFIWYFLFALFFIPGFGYLWSYLFYRLNQRAASLWYTPECVARLKAARIKAVIRFDMVNSGTCIIFILLGILLLSLALMTGDRTSTKVQSELMSGVSYLMLSSADHALGLGAWRIEDGKLYKGDDVMGDANDPEHFLEEASSLYTTSYYVKATDLPAEMAAKYNPDDYVAIKCYAWDGTGPRPEFGDTLNPEAVQGVLGGVEQNWYETIKFQRELTEEEEQYREQLRNTKEGYFRYCMGLNTNIDLAIWDTEGNPLIIGIIEMYIPASILTEQIKTAEHSSDYIMTFAIIAIFAILFAVTHRWIKTLEQSHDFLKVMAEDAVPEKPLYLGKRLRGVVMARELNAIRERRQKKQLR